MEHFLSAKTQLKVLRAMLPDQIETIHRYTEDVRQKKIKPTCNCCPRCHKEPGRFTLHDCRERTFLVVVERTIKRVLSLLTRWKCPLCKHPFTLYPPFALPNKRYVRTCVFELTEGYLEHDLVSYREAVKVGSMPVFHDLDASGTIDDRTLSHSTLHRWIPFFSALTATFTEALRLIRERSATSDLFRRIFPFAPEKYCSEERRGILARALKALAVEREFRGLFNRSIFPELATACAWR